MLEHFSGTLYIVATPIGNLKDFSPRAQQVLEDSDFILCEDTRHTRILLNHFSISKPLYSLHKYNEFKAAESLIDKIKTSTGKKAALVSDAGTPSISDPGHYLISAARAANIQILSIPGPSSLISALAASGFNAPRSIFSGFLGRSSSERKKEFENWRKIAPCNGIFFESPKRIINSLHELLELTYVTQICVSREISKHFEEHIVGTVSDVIKILENKEKIKGEFVVCIHIPEPQEYTNHIPDISDIQISTKLEDGMSTKKQIKSIAAKIGVKPKDLYNKYQTRDKGK